MRKGNGGGGGGGGLHLLPGGRGEAHRYRGRRAAHAVEPGAGLWSGGAAARGRRGAAAMPRRPRRGSRGRPGAIGRHPHVPPDAVGVSAQVRGSPGHSSPGKGAARCNGRGGGGRKGGTARWGLTCRPRRRSTPRRAAASPPGRPSSGRPGRRAEAPLRPPQLLRCRGGGLRSREGGPRVSSQLCLSS